MKKKDYLETLLEDMNDRYKLILEAVAGTQKNVAKIPRMAERLEELQSNMKLLKIRTEKLEAIQDEVIDLEKRLKVLETT